MNISLEKYINTKLLLFLFVFSFACDDGDEAPAPVAETLTEALQIYLDENQASDSPGVSAMIKQGNEVLMINKGLSRLLPVSQINQTTQFRTASVSKPISATAIMKLVEDGLLNLDEKLIDIIPNLPSSYAEITIRHLLLHTSGLRDYIDDNTNQEDLDNFSNQDLINSLAGSNLDILQFTPGTNADYSNTGYALLASVIEEKSGMSYPDYLKSQIFDPIGMSDSYVIDQNVQLGDNGDNYALSFARTHLLRGFNSIIYGPNGIVSSVQDLSLFLEAFLAGEIVSEENISLMTQAQSSVPGIADYGLGWMTGAGNYWHNEVYTNPSDFWHTGGFDGYRTVLYHSHELKLSVIVLTNNGDSSQQIMFDILELARDYSK